jgi:hypothetical protein
MRTAVRMSTGLLIATLSLTVVPLIIFPQQLGLPLARVSIATLLLELAYFCAATFLFDRETTFGRLAAAVGLCLVYRYSLGALFGVLAVAFYSIGWSAALQFGLFSYLPAVILQAAAAPLVVRMALAPAADEPRRTRPTPRETVAQTQPSSGLTSISISREKGIFTESQVPRPAPEVEARRQHAANIENASNAPVEINGFERATRYLGEHGSVYLAAVVDNEGLLLANFRRGSVVVEDWAPLALLFLDANRRVLNRATRALGTPEKLDVMLKDTRILIARDTSFSLMVMAERHSDETLQIRFNQALDMVRKYFAERYSSKQESNAERIHVSNTK